MAVTLDEFKKATTALGKAVAAEKTDLSRDATIQRFEFCVELAWKTARKAMGTATSAPKQVVREMAQANLVDDVELWLKAIDQRNLSVHTYNEDLAEEVYAFASKFVAECDALITRLDAG